MRPFKIIKVIEKQTLDPKDPVQQEELVSYGFSFLSRPFIIKRKEVYQDMGLKFQKGVTFRICPFQKKTPLMEEVFKTTESDQRNFTEANFIYYVSEVMQCDSRLALMDNFFNDKDIKIDNLDDLQLVLKEPIKFNAYKKQSNTSLDNTELEKQSTFSLPLEYNKTTVVFRAWAQISFKMGYYSQKKIHMAIVDNEELRFELADEENKGLTLVRGVAWEHNIDKKIGSNCLWPEAVELKLLEDTRNWISVLMGGILVLLLMSIICVFIFTLSPRVNMRESEAPLLRNARESPKL